MSIRLVAADEHVLLRMGLARIAAGCADIEMVGEAGTCADAIDIVERLKPDVVTIDLNLPDGDGVATAQRLRQSLPDLGVVLLTVISTDALLFRALEAGISAYLTKSATVPMVLAAIRHASVAPHAFTAPGLAAALSRRSRQSGLLSHREQQVLALMREGATLPAIAAQLSVSTATVKTYVARLYGKLKVKNRAQALMIAANLGLLSDESAA
jgi:DNA-binding NarL/FixJ family response regulator